MIPAKELRLRNLVYNPNKSKVIEVMLLDATYDKTQWHPIPLTEEWLLKLGFIKTTNFNRFDFYMRVNHDTVFMHEKTNTIVWLDEHLINIPLEYSHTNKQIISGGSTHDSNSYELKESNKGFNFDFGMECTRKGVHWFQNWFYFKTGEELTIKEDSITINVTGLKPNTEYDIEVIVSDNETSL